MASNNAQMNHRYGRPGSFRPVAVQDRLPWVPRRSDGTVQAVLAHPLIAEEFVAACQAAASASSWTPQRIDSYVPRAIRNYFKGSPPKGWRLGDRGTSNHAWATAFDFFATPADVPPPGGVWTPNNGVPPEFAKVFEGRGWTWGGRWRRTDTPHIEFTGEPPAGRLLEPDYADWLTGMLKQGDTGSGVLNLQLGLLMAGLEGVELTAVFGPVTTGLVRQVQSLADIVVDGIVGPATERAIAGLWEAALPSTADAVLMAYRRVLGRTPQTDERSWWVERVHADGLNPARLARMFWESDEAARQRGHKPPSKPPPPPPPAPPSAPSDALTADELAEAFTRFANEIREL